jgi:hypothetical protein
MGSREAISSKGKAEVEWGATGRELLDCWLCVECIVYSACDECSSVMVGVGGWW